jgi:hypothetical protein
MATIEIDNLAKMNILKSAYSSVVSSFATICYQLGIDPFSIDLDTFVPPQEDETLFGGSMARQLTAMRNISAEILALES